MCKFILISFFLGIFIQSNAQFPILTLQQQEEDFEVFKGGLKEGHAGIHYFIDKATFDSKCDSIQRTFTAQTTTEAFYLKLRYLLTLLRHGHSRINLPADRYENFKLGILNRDRHYLPLQLIVLDNKLYVLSDCSTEQTVAKGAEIKTINGISVRLLINMMLDLIPADGINTSFKYYNLYNYYYFHFLYNLLYPTYETFELEFANSHRAVVIRGKTPSDIQKTYQEINQKDISYFENPLRYDAFIAKNTAYLKVGSFYKGFIENFGNKYELFIDSVFQDLAKKNTENLILDLRNNEGGGDGYEHFLFAHFTDKPFKNAIFDQVASRKFPFAKYAVNLSDDVKAYIQNPSEFLRDDSTLILKPQYAGVQFISPAKDVFRGNVYVLTNGGSFSATNTFLRFMYQHRQSTPLQKIQFIGEENGGDIYSNVMCAGQGYTIRLPQSLITVDMPILAEGTLNKIYPSKRLPDETIIEKIDDIMSGNDSFVSFVLTLIK
jgi:hypothetical protein